MHRNVTNAIRFFLDECIPPLIRDSRWFMYPAFYIWYKGKNVRTYMDFKSIVHDMSEEEYARVYEELDCLATDRPTDLNTHCIKHMIDNIPDDATSLLDMGCGRGYFLEQVGKARPDLKLTGCDIMRDVTLKVGEFVQGNIEKLPFEDNSFDVVTCSHTLEHIVNVKPAIEELKRVAKRRLVIVVPKQRYYYYTLDMHVHFFPYKEKLTHLIGMEKASCVSKWGDWVFMGYKD